MTELNWSEEQWQTVNAAVAETHGKTSVANSFLPMYGPLEGSTVVVRNERLKTDYGQSGPPTVRLDKNHDSVNQNLVNVTANVELTSEQVADNSLSNALLTFRRAGSILAHEQDRVIFEGLRRQPRQYDSKYIANTIIQPQEGLADLPNRMRFRRFDSFPPTEASNTRIVSTIVELTQMLESNYSAGPFACILGSDLYSKIHEPSPSLVLPADRIAPLLSGGPMLRATTMYAKAGIVVSLADNAVDVVIGTPPKVQLLQRTQNARYLFRVYTRFALRIRDKVNSPVAGFRLQTSNKEDTFELASLNLAEAECTL